MTGVPVIKKKFLKKGEQFGKGYFADVFKGMLVITHDNIVPVAIKEPVDDAEKLAWAAKESVLLYELRGEAGVPTLYGVTTSSPPALVMSLCEGELLQKVYERGEVHLCLRALLQVCDVVRRLHVRCFSHGDIHARNVLVDTSDEGDVNVTLLDFGLATKYNYVQQMQDVEEVATMALMLIPNTKNMSDLRRKLNKNMSDLRRKLKSDSDLDIDMITEIVEDVLSMDDATL